MLSGTYEEVEFEDRALFAAGNHLLPRKLHIRVSTGSSPGPPCGLEEVRAQSDGALSRTPLALRPPQIQP